MYEIFGSRRQIRRVRHDRSHVLIAAPQIGQVGDLRRRVPDQTIEPSASRIYAQIAFRAQAVERERFAFAIVDAARRDDVAQEHARCWLGPDTQAALRPAVRIQNDFVRQILEQAVVRQLNLDEIAADTAMLGLVELAGRGGRHQKARAGLSGNLQMRRVVFDKSAARIVQQQKRLVVAVLVIAALPLIRNPARDRFQLSAAVLQLGSYREKRVLPDDPCRIGYCEAAQQT